MGSAARLSAIACRTVFLVDGRAFSVRDVVDAAAFRGDLDDAVRRSAPPEGDPGNLQARVDAFRYGRDLITAEETERWLEDRGLSLDDLSRHFSGEDEAPEDAPLPALWLSGEMDELSRALAWRVAAGRDRPAAGEPEVADERGRFLCREGLDERSLPGWLSARERDGAWLEEQFRREAAYRALAESLLEPEALARALARARPQLTRVEVEILELDTPDAAREAWTCILEDGQSMEEVAGEGGYPHERREAVVEDLPDDLQRRVLSAAPGELLDAPGEGPPHVLVRIASKVEPDLADPSVRQRLERRVLDARLSDLAARHVRWVLGPDGSA